MKKFLIASVGVAAIVGLAVVWLRAAPTVGAISAAPAYVVINTPTPVVLTVAITDPTLLAGGVNLLQTDAAGKTLSTIGVMHDDGLNGDATANNRVFSFRVTVNQQTVGQIFYRVSAAFRGVLQRSLSVIISVHVDPIVLPADPGAAGRQTLAGVDSDQDGLRDDVQRWIALSYLNKPTLRAALTQLARANQDFVVQSGSDRTVIVQLNQRRIVAMRCLYLQNGGNVDLAAEQRLALRSILLDTPERSRAFVTADTKLSGLFFPESNPARDAEGCQ